MAFLKRLFGGKSAPVEAASLPDAPCAHTALVPRWDSAADIGDASKATSYTCESCRESFDPEQAGELRANEEERLRNLLE